MACAAPSKLLLWSLVLEGQGDCVGVEWGSGGCIVFSGAGSPWEMPPRHQSQGLEEGVQVGPGVSKGKAGDEMD